MGFLTQEHTKVHTWSVPLKMKSRSMGIIYMKNATPQQPQRDKKCAEGAFLKNVLRVVYCCARNTRNVACSGCCLLRRSLHKRVKNPKSKVGPIRFAAFNIQVFGDAKIADHFKRTSLVKIISNFDLIAVQGKP